jgi:2-octaprenyl-6-methoxyphenol hydroxylase
MHVDLTIVGGGLVGASLACALRSSGLRIALLDARNIQGEDPRLFALHAASCQLLKNLHCWEALSPFAAPIHQVHVSHQGHFGTVRLHREEVALPALGYVIPAREIELTLEESLKTVPQLISLRPAKLKSLRSLPETNHLVIETAQGEENIYSTFVIGADGADSTVRKEANIATDVFDYQQSALVTRTTLQRPHQHIAYERFYAHGAIAMLPLIDSECATIWTADNSTIQHLRQLSGQAFLHALQTEFGYRLGRLAHTGERYVFPLRMSRAKQSMRPGGTVFLLGNSAHALHPIAAQGFNLALYELAVLAEAILDKTAHGLSFTAKDLQAVQERIMQQQSLSIFVSHRLARLFLPHEWAFSFAVQLGMIGLNTCTFIKRKFMERILARAGKVPRLLLATDGL